MCQYYILKFKTIADDECSRNLKHLNALTTVKKLLENLRAESVHFVIRLNLGSHPPRLTKAHQQTVVLKIAPGDTAVSRQLYYKDCGAVNVIGV
ncbi:hypothetical protein ANRL1_04451 [Anaerolineae bacterium]|nr:hypothetical protein ANRL1_04451 [Anaerolineae bacterium]